MIELAKGKVTVKELLEIDVKDLEKNKVQFIGDVERRIHEDYLRILRFFRFIRDNKPSIMTGYNVFGFDWDYILRRMRVLRIPERAIQGMHEVSGCFARVQLLTEQTSTNSSTYRAS